MATKIRGQSQGLRGPAGPAQVVRVFKEGGYNTLVATCIGEEGLDIGEVCALAFRDG